MKPRSRTTVGISLTCLFLAFGSSIAIASRSSGPHYLIVKVDFTTHPSATRAQEHVVARMLQANPKVKKFVFVPKEVALAKIKKLDPSYVTKIPWNPLPDTITVTPTKSEYAPELAKSLVSLPGVQAVLTGHS